MADQNFDFKIQSPKDIILLLGFLIFMVLFFIQKCNNEKSGNKEVINLVNALNDSMRVQRLSDSSVKATISALQTEKISTFLALQVKDSSVKILQELVKDYKKKLEAGSSVTSALIETMDSIKSKTTILRLDTVMMNKTIYIWPTYMDSAKGEDKKWIDYLVIANKDSVHLNLKVQDEFDAIVGVDHKKPFVDLISHNPYSAVKTLRTYQVSQPKPKRFGLGINFGYGVGESFKFTPFIGVGIQYNVIRF